MALPDESGELVITRTAGVATLWLNRPAKRNAVTYDMWSGIAASCGELAADPGVRVLVVRGVGDHFCAGADIAGLGDGRGSDYSALNKAADDALATFPKPTIAFIVGNCIGGGAEIAIACDLRIADTTARFGITPARLGLVYPAFALERAVHVLGASATKHLLYTAEIIDADRAQRIGLVDELHDPPAAVARLDELTGRLAAGRSLLTQMASKEMIDSVTTTGGVDPAIERRWTEAMASSPDAAEGIAAFLERRPPRFTWQPPES